MDKEGVEVFEGTVTLIRVLRGKERKIGCVSSSKNCRPVLERAGLTALFDAIVDGNDLEREHLAGKPAPDTYLRGAALLGAAPARAAVIEDAVAGVAAGHAGRFKLVIGVDRGAGHAALLAAGADIVVDDMAEFVLD
jgi:HAD superfamily hydrolase (TIGR01509 family)